MFYRRFPQALPLPQCPFFTARALPAGWVSSCSRRNNTPPPAGPQRPPHVGGQVAIPLRREALWGHPSRGPWSALAARGTVPPAGLPRWPREALAPIVCAHEGGQLGAGSTGGRGHPEEESRCALGGVVCVLPRASTAPAEKKDLVSSARTRSLCNGKVLKISPTIAPRSGCGRTAKATQEPPETQAARRECVEIDSKHRAPPCKPEKF